MIRPSPLCGQALPELLVSLSVGRKLKEDISILPTVINYGEFLHTRDGDLTPHVTPGSGTSSPFSSQQNIFHR